MLKKNVLGWLLMLLVLFGSIMLSKAQVRVTLVGTGGPELTPERAGEATLIEANGTKFIV